MRRPNHASRFEGIAKTKLQASRASDTETLQSQVNKAAEKRLSLSGLEVLHGRLFRVWPRSPASLRSLAISLRRRRSFQVGCFCRKVLLSCRICLCRVSAFSWFFL